jgi:oxalate decarboxylase/phosphoglucose isomerase-like protein (cupin superfamily)
MTELVTADRSTLLENFARRPFAVTHALVEHPLLRLERIARLAESLHESQVESNPGTVPDVLPDGVAGARTGTESVEPAPGEIVRGIETNGRWIVLKKIESDPEYRALLEESLEAIVPHVAHTEGGAVRKEAFIFISAPGSTTPSHIDPEHNLLLQIRGSKDMIVGAFPDPDTREAEIERQCGGGHRNLPDLPTDPTTFHMKPGDGVYVPIYAPHMVKNGPAVSISFSITFYTEESERMRGIYSMNARLRRLRMNPRRPGEHAGSDRVKSATWRAARQGALAVRRLRGGPKA